MSAVGLYCVACAEAGRPMMILPDESICRTCAGVRVACLECDQIVGGGLTYCPRCSRAHSGKEITIRGGGAGALGLPDLPVMMVPVVPRVEPVYDAGKFGVSAVVTMPRGDVSLLNALGEMVPALHSLASRLNGFQGLTDHTRELIRDMRLLATKAQEEIEARRGPRG